MTSKELEKEKVIKRLQLKLNSLDEEIDENGIENSYIAIKEYRRINIELDAIMNFKNNN